MSPHLLVVDFPFEIMNPNLKLSNQIVRKMKSSGAAAASLLYSVTVSSLIQKIIQDPALINSSHSRISRVNNLLACIFKCTLVAGRTEFPCEEVSIMKTFALSQVYLRERAADISRMKKSA